MTCSLAANNGYIVLLQWLRANGCPWDRDVCASAAKGGHLEILKWARENGARWYKGKCLKLAVENKDEKMIEWIKGNN